LLLLLRLRRNEGTLLKGVTGWLSPLTKFPFGVVETRIRIGTGSRAVDEVEVAVVDSVLNVDLGVDVATVGGLIAKRRCE